MELGRGRRSGAGGVAARFGVSPGCFSRRHGVGYARPRSRSTRQGGWNGTTVREFGETMWYRLWLRSDVNTDFSLEI